MNESETTSIEWADYTFNPWLGCTKVSPACANCYAERDFDHRRKRVKWGPNGNRVMTGPDNWRKPIQWNAAARANGTRPRVFCASLADVFESWRGGLVNHGGETIVACDDYVGPMSKMSTAQYGGRPIGVARLADVRRLLFSVIQSTPELVWLLLTKRPENVIDFWPQVSGVADGDPAELLSLSNVWLGTTVEDQKHADERLPYLHDAKARDLVSKTFVSAEPLVGPVSLERYIGNAEGLDWIITGGESGPNARPAEPDWFRDLRDEAAAARVPFLFKQWGEWLPFEDDQAPLIKGQDETFRDRHELPDGLVDHEPVDRWLWPDGRSATLHFHAGKKAAGRKLDGVIHEGFPK